MKHFKSGILLLVFSFLFILVACAPSHFTPLEKKVYTTTKTLEAAVEFRDTGLSIASDFYKRGLLSVEKKDKIIKIGDELYDAILITKEALKMYNSGGSYNDLSAKLILYHQIYGKFSEILMPYLLKNL